MKGHILDNFMTLWRNPLVLVHLCKKAYAILSRKEVKNTCEHGILLVWTFYQRIDKLKDASAGDIFKDMVAVIYSFHNFEHAMSVFQVQTILGSQA